MKDTAAALLMLFILAAAIKFCMPETALELQRSAGRLLDPKGIVAAMSNEISSSGIIDAFSQIIGESGKY